MATTFKGLKELYKWFEFFNFLRSFEEEVKIKFHKKSKVFWGQESYSGGEEEDWECDDGVCGHGWGREKRV